ncbi:ABC transporter ATP-binding protein [Candidatus Bathyarchaeota archaeon]|nr:MAG: ABC transporter ATP-binding protein [Candidatus Bathyarchaeota archaeon]
MPEVQLVNVTKTFEKGKIVAVDDVSFRVQDKEYFSLIGPSGCGKTTLLRIVAGLVQPDEGEIHIENKLVNPIPPEDRCIGFVFQTYALFPHMNVWDNVTYGPRVKAWGNKERTRIGREMLEMVRLYERLDALPSELSGGMMQRVALARALAAGAKLLLLDEPLGALDAKIRFELRYELRKFVKDLGLTAIHVTHDQGEAMAISDRIAVMRKGKILQVGTPQELYMKPQHIFVAHFIGESNFLEGYITEVDKNGSLVKLRGRLTVHVSDKTKNKGERVVLMVRPETFKMEEGRKKRVNSMFGHIEKFRFEGTNIRYEVILENEDRIAIIRPTLIGEWFNVGDKVTVSFSPNKSYIFTYPSKGLREELTLE